jgi:NAD-dependent deacetylase
MAPEAPCPSCGTPATGPDIVWFGEMPYGMEQISNALAQADVFVSIGTSGEVYPAANFVNEADMFGAHTVELNLEPSSGVSRFAETHFGPATQVVPTWVAKELSRNT